MWGPSQGPEPDAQTGLRRPAPAGIAEGEQPACAAAAGPSRARMGAQGGGGGGWAPSPGAEFRLEMPRVPVGDPSWGKGTGRRCDFVCAGAAWREGRGGAPGGLWSSQDAGRQPSGLARPSLLWKYARAPLFCQASFWAPGRTGKHTKSCSGAGVRPCVLPSSVVRGRSDTGGVSCNLACGWVQGSGSVAWLCGLAPPPVWP